MIKILSDDISHKSDVGGVRLGLERADEARRAAEDMLQRIARLMPAARIKGFTVQPMIRRPDAHELILGMSVDPTFGPLMMFGAGGTAVEVLRDTAHALPPLDLNLARDLMRQTRVWQLLQGYRNRPAVDVDRIAEVLVRLSYLVARHPEIREIDINPLIADDKDVIALDARVRVADAAASPRVPMAIRPYPSEWETEAQIEPVGAIAIRPIRPRGRAALCRLLRPRDAGRPAASLLRRRAAPVAPVPGNADADRLRARDGVRGDRQADRRPARRRARRRRPGLHAAASTRSCCGPTSRAAASAGG